MNRLSRVLLFASILLLVFFSLIDFVETCTLSNVFVSQQMKPCSYYAIKKDFAVTLGGCALGCADGSWSTQRHIPLTFGYTVICDRPDAKWKTTCSEGETCKLRWNWDCSGSFEGKWDPDEGECVQCSGRIQIRKYKCANTGGTATNTCEEACGAPSECEEKPPGFSLPDNCGIFTLEVNRKCTSDCSYRSTRYTCNPDNCGASVRCGGRTYNCVYAGGTGTTIAWFWSEAIPDNFCCNDGVCPDCANNVVKKCVDYRCACRPCKINSDCISGYCCEVGIGDANGDGDAADCVGRGSIAQPYLCTSSSPAFWLECDEKNVGATAEIDGVKYVCSLENGNYEWSIAQIRRPNVSIIQLFQKLFSRLFQL